MILAAAVMVLLPLSLALLLLLPSWRLVVVRALGLAPLPALVLFPAAWRAGSLSATLPSGWTLVLDQPGVLMLAASALLWSAAGFAASRWLAQRDGGPRFALWWLLTLSGSLGVFVAGDVVSFYALYALASLPVYGLIAFEGCDQDCRAGRITLAAALIGEGLILAAVVLMAVAAPGQGLAIATLVQALPQSASSGLVIALVVIGFGLKIALVPLHGWMPLSYAAGPLAATAVLSGATSKAGLIGLIRFLPLGEAMPVAGGLILAAGLASALYGAGLGLTQSNPRSVLAYSSISHLGQMTAVLGAGLAAGLPGAVAAVAFYAAYHVLAKGGLFLMLGAQVPGRVPARWQIALSVAVALGFAGLPLTGGALGKLAFKGIAGSGVTGFLLSLAAIGSTALMLHFLRLAFRGGRPAPEAALPASAWIATGLVAMLLPWSLFGPVTGFSMADALKPGVLLELAWPILVGAALAGGLAMARMQAPGLLPGDMGAAGIAMIERISHFLAPIATEIDLRARRWHVSSLLIGATLVIFALALGLPALQ